MNIRNIEKQDLGSLSQLYWDCFTEELTWEKWTTWTASKLLNFFYDKQKDLFFFGRDRLKDSLSSGFHRKTLTRWKFTGRWRDFCASRLSERMNWK